jgi:hypothetical protein
VRGNVLAKIFRRIADAVEKLDEVELKTFLINLERTEFAFERRSTKNRHAKVDLIALEELLVQLSEMSKRTAGSRLLDESNLSRKQLEALARLRNVHVTKDDNVAKIKEKLIEAIIGARLSSRAIRGSQESE